MTDTTYYAPTGGLPPQTQLLTDRAMFTEAYAVIPRGTRTSSPAICRSGTRPGSGCWPVRCRALPRPSRNTSWRSRPAAAATGPNPTPAPRASCSWSRAKLTVTAGWQDALARPGGYAYLPPGKRLDRPQQGGEPVRFHWVRKAYEPSTASMCRSLSFANEQDDRTHADARHQRPLGNHPLRRSGRPAPRHARHHRDA